MKQSKKSKPPVATWQRTSNLADLLLITVMPAGPGPLPIAQIPSAEVNARCDEWFDDALSGRDETAPHVPDDLAPWLAARILVARVLIQAHIYDKLPDPDRAEADELHDMLIDRWNSHSSGLWLDFSYQGDNVFFKTDGRVLFKDTLLLCEKLNPDEKAKLLRLLEADLKKGEQERN